MGNRKKKKERNSSSFKEVGRLMKILSDTENQMNFWKNYYRQIDMRRYDAEDQGRSTMHESDIASYESRIMNLQSRISILQK
jgi:hypothetical protein